MIRKLSVGAVAAFISLTVSASAADLPARMPVKAVPVVAPAFSWTGCFIGGNAGGLWATKNWRAAPGEPTIGFGGVAVGTPFGSHDVNSWVAGAQLGCDYQFAGNWVIGIQGDYDWSAITTASSTH